MPGERRVLGPAKRPDPCAGHDARRRCRLLGYFEGAAPDLQLQKPSRCALLRLLAGPRALETRAGLMMGARQKRVVAIAGIISAAGSFALPCVAQQSITVFGCTRRYFDMCSILDTPLPAVIFSLHSSTFPLPPAYGTPVSVTGSMGGLDEHCQAATLNVTTWHYVKDADCPSPQR
jgi:hypothetical protein